MEWWEDNRTPFQMEVATFIQQTGIKQTQISEETGINKSLLSLWLRNKVSANQDRSVTTTLKGWMENKRAGLPITAAVRPMPQAPPQALPPMATIRSSPMPLAVPTGMQPPPTQRYQPPPPAPMHTIRHMPPPPPMQSQPAPMPLSLPMVPQPTAAPAPIAAHPAVPPAPLPKPVVPHIPVDPIKAIKANLSRQDVELLTPGTLPTSSGREWLVPISLSIKQDGHQLDDTFMWNLFETHITPSTFAAGLCRDLNLPLGMVDVIASSIVSQLVVFRERLCAAGATSGPAAKTATDMVPEWAVSVVHMPSLTGGDHVRTLEIRVRALDTVYEDKLQWDMSDPRNCASQFASTVAADLGLDPSICPTIAAAVQKCVNEYWLSLGSTPMVSAAAPTRGIRDAAAAFEWEPHAHRVAIPPAWGVVAPSCPPGVAMPRHMFTDVEE